MDYKEYDYYNRTIDYVSLVSEAVFSYFNKDIW